MNDITTLGLRLPTDPRWVNIASMNIEDILIDHAYCEQKAASSAISMIIKYYNKPEVIKALSPLVEEEWQHFNAVIAEMEKRNIKLGKPRKDEYVGQLQKFVIRGGSIDWQFMDDMLMLAMVEARSAERFKLLSEEIQDLNLKQFYHELMISEATHYRNYIRLAEHYQTKETVRKRWLEWLEKEAEIIKNLEIKKDRFH